MYNFDPYNVLLSIATNIALLLMTATKAIILSFFISVIMSVLQYCNSMVYELICQFK